MPRRGEWGPDREGARGSAQGAGCYLPGAQELTESHQSVRELRAAGSGLLQQTGAGLG